MRKILLKLLAIAAVCVIATEGATAQSQNNTDSATEETSLVAQGDSAVVENDQYNPETDIEGGVPLHQTLKRKFLEGGAGWMTPILLCLIFGLAIVIERIIYLNLSTVNTKKFEAQVEHALAHEGIDAAMEVCRNTRGPVASIYYQGMSRYDEGLDVVEKSIVSYGSVQMGRMENGLPWISLFIAIAPMLGFLGTVVGMVESFDAIQAAGDISPSLVAGGIKIALLTTLAGLIVAIILQLFYSYIITKIDSLVISMEDSSITLVDMLSKYSRGKLNA